jgi:hypothetical protein
LVASQDEQYASDVGLRRENATMDGQRPPRLLRARFAPINLACAVSLLALGCAGTAGAQTIQGDVSSVASWQAPGVSQSHVVPVDGRTSVSPELVRSASVHFVDSAKAPTPVLAGNPAIHVTNAATAPTPKIAIDPRVNVSDDSKAPPLPTPVNTKVQLIVSS